MHLMIQMIQYYKDFLRIMKSATCLIVTLDFLFLILLFVEVRSSARHSDKNANAICIALLHSYIYTRHTKF